jgi:hypothetical protein
MYPYFFRCCIGLKLWPIKSCLISRRLAQHLNAAQSVPFFAQFSHNGQTPKLSHGEKSDSVVISH